MKKKFAVLLLAGLAAAGAAGYGLTRLQAGGEKAADGASVPVVSVQELQSSSAAVNTRFSGVVETQKKKSISLDQEKTVDKILVSEGDHVNEKDALFTYDTEKTLLEISRKELEKEKLNSEIAGFKEQIDQLNTELARGNLSSADRMSMNAQILEHQTAIAQAEYDLKVADSEISSLNAAVTDSTVRSPMAGRVEKVEDPALLTDSADAFIIIAADGDFRIRGTMSEQNFGAVYQGQKMLVRSRLNSDTWIGTVSSMESGQEEGQEDQNTGSDSNEQASRYSFYVTLESRDDLMLGQHVTLEPWGEEMEGLVLPLGYLTSDEEGNTCVYAVKEPGDRLEKRTVETGEEYESQGMIRILSGLEEEDYVVWPDNENCVEGAATSGNYFADQQQ